MVRPMAGLPAASAMPRAAEMPTRSPVKLPGPVVTAMRSSSANSISAAIHDARDQRHQRFGMAAHHGERFARLIPAAAVSSTAAEQASSAVSMARTRMIELDRMRSENVGSRSDRGDASADEFATCG